MRNTSIVQLLVVLSIVGSMSSMSAATSSANLLPSILFAHATIVTPPAQLWTPAGPAMNTELASIFTDATAEFTSMSAAAPGMDMMDWPLSSSQTVSLAGSANAYSVTSPVSEQGTYEIEFDQANSFWGCNFNFASTANSPGAPPTDCGTRIRQAISHLIDKKSFVGADVDCATKCTPIDNPVPPASGGGSSPNPCPWDTLFPGTSLANCVIGAAGGVSFNCVAEASPCPTGSGTATGKCGSETSPAACAYTWMYPFGSPDFCAAAQYMIAAGLAATIDLNCVLIGISPSVTGNPINFYIRNDDLIRLRMGTAIAETICALFTGGYTLGCISGSSTDTCVETSTTTFAPGAILCVTEGGLLNFPGLNTGISSPNANWWMYTAESSGAFPFDHRLYFNFNSLFVSGTTTPPCASKTPSFSADNYDYVCNSTYDLWSQAMEAALCASAAGDPTAGTCPNAPPGTNCPSTPSSCSAISGSFYAEELIGQGIYSIPIYSRADNFAYLDGWINAINSQGAGIPNYYTWLNSYNPASSMANTMRQGFEQTTASLNPYTAKTAHDFYILGNIYDTVYKANPVNNLQVMDWMTKSHVLVSNSQLGYPPLPGTVVTIRNFLRNDLFWQDGRKVNALDVAFTYLSMMANGAWASAPALATVLGVYITSSNSFDLSLRYFGPYTLLTIGSLPIIPGHIWSQNCAGPLWPPPGGSTAEPVIYDQGPPAADGIFGAGDVVVNPIGFVPATGSTLKIDPKIMYVGGATWASGDPVIYDSGTNLGFYDPSDIVITSPFTPAPAIGAALKADPLLTFIDSSGNTLWDSSTGPGIVTGYAGGFCMSADPAKTSPSYDPILSGTLVGSGPWVCENTGVNAAVPVGTVGTGCSSTNTENPPAGGSYTLTRYGCKYAGTCLQPASSVAGLYSRSSGNLALWFWSGNIGSVSHDLVNISTLANCFNKPLGTAGCTHWQQGIGAPSGSAVVGLIQISETSRYYLLNWASPFSWGGLTGIATGPGISFDGLPAPVLYEESSFLMANKLNPASVVGCALAYPTSGYDC